MFISGGENVYPAEVEAALMRQPRWQAGYKVSKSVVFVREIAQNEYGKVVGRKLKRTATTGGEHS